MLSEEWRTVEPWRLLGPMALVGAAGGALWVFLTRGFLPGIGPDSGVDRLLYAWWIPGLLVGITMSATLRFEPHRALAFSTVTGIIYSLAIGLTVGLRQMEWGMSTLPFAWQGAVSGGASAWLFHHATGLMLGVRPARGDAGVVVLGALLGGVLAHVLLSGGARPLVIATSSAWTATVGFASYRSLHRSQADSRSLGPATQRTGEVLRSRAVQALGVGITLASMLSLLANLV